jgi:hypothetical protein
MKAEEFEALMDRIGFDAPSLASTLEIDYNQCRKYLCGQTKIPAEVERKALLLEQHEKFLDNQRQEKYVQFLNTQPHMGFKVTLLPEPICRNK